MSNLTIFLFEDQEVRFVGTPENPWWVAQDVCKILGIQNVTQAISKLDDDERSMFNIGRQGDAWSINESGLYSLVVTSRKESAKRFKKWLTSEVLPSIRKTGKYEVTTPQSDPIPQLGEREVFLLEVLKLGVDTAKYVKDDRAVLVYNTQLQNLSQRTAASLTSVTGVATLPSLPEPNWLTVSEVLERAGFPLSHKAYQNSLGQVGKLVKTHFMAETGEPVKSVVKAVGSNHRPTNIKAYPEHYHERIVDIALEYWDEKGIGMN